MTTLKSIFHVDFFKSFFESRKPADRPVMRTFHCSIEECGRATLQKENTNPRLRWIDTTLQDPDTLEWKKVILCPEHAREILHLDEEFYERTERTEAFVTLENAR